MHRHHAEDVAARLALAFDLGRAGGDMSEESEQRRRLPPFEGERLPEQFVDRIARLAPQSALELAPPVARHRQQDRKSTRLNSSHDCATRMLSSARSQKEEAHTTI